MEGRKCKNGLAKKARWISADRFIILLSPGVMSRVGWKLCCLRYPRSTFQKNCAGPALQPPCHLLWRMHCLWTSHICSYILFDSIGKSLRFMFLNWHCFPPFSRCSSAFWGSKYFAFSNFSCNDGRNIGVMGTEWHWHHCHFPSISLPWLALLLWEHSWFVCCCLLSRLCCTSGWTWLKGIGCQRQLGFAVKQHCYGFFKSLLLFVYRGHSEVYLTESKGLFGLVMCSGGWGLQGQLDQRAHDQGFKKSQLDSSVGFLCSCHILWPLPLFRRMLLQDFWSWCRSAWRSDLHLDSSLTCAMGSGMGTCGVLCDDFNSKNPRRFWGPARWDQDWKH